MDGFRQLLCRLTAVLRRKRLDAEMAEEMRLHLELRAQANLDAGMPPDDARREARRQFGGVAQIEETCRDERTIRWIEQLVQDVRHAARTLSGAPVFTAVAVLSLALGIGANSAIFSLLNAVLLRSLPVRAAHELREVSWVGRNPRVSNYTGSGMGRTGSGLTYACSFSYPAYCNLRDRAAGFTDVFAFFPLISATALAEGQATIVDGLLVSGNFFRGYGSQTLIGRPISDADDRPGAAPAAVITYSCWERLFSLDPNVIGRSITLNRSVFTIIGVLPRSFAGPFPGDPTDVYVPLSAQPQLAPGRPLSSSRHWWVQIMARLAPGANEEQARASLEALFLEELRLSDNRMENPGILLEDGSRGPLMTRRRMGQPLWLLMAVVGLVLLITCANLASLLLARGEARRHEMSMRAALGASRGRLIRQQITESLLLTLAGGVLGLALASWIKGGMLQFLTGRFAGNLRFDARTDSNVLTFTLAISVVTAILFGLLPALRATRVDPVEGLRDRPGLGTPRLRLGRILVSLQVGLSVVLVIVAGLMVRTFVNLAQVDPGFDPENLLVFRLNPAQAGYEGPRLAGYFESMRQSLAALPGVTAVGLSDHALVGGGISSEGISIPGRTAAPDEHLQSSQMIVSDSFFAAMGMGLRGGRNFAAADTEKGPKVVIVNEVFAQSFFAGANPLGKQFRIGSDAYEIIGICGNAKYDSLRRAVEPTMYLLDRQNPTGAMYFEVRSAVPPVSLTLWARKAAAAVDPEIPLADLATQRVLMRESISVEQLFATLCSSLALLAVLLSFIGLYGLIAYNVARRTGEIGIRMALGARPRDVAGPILREALMMAGAGIAIGLPAALALSQVIRAGLYGVALYDPATLAGGTVLLLIIAVLAAWIPARRAARIDPLAALRCE
jgi:predicted permease